MGKNLDGATSNKQYDDDSKSLLEWAEEFFAEEFSGSADRDGISKVRSIAPRLITTKGASVNKCPKCHALMERRVRANDDIKEGQKYYFIAWDYCLKCGHIQHHEKYKVKTDDDFQQALEKYLQGRLEGRVRT